MTRRLLHVLVALVWAVPASAGAGADAPGIDGSLDVVETHRVSPHRHVYALAFNGEDGVAVGALGTLLISDDGGQSWNDRSRRSELSLLAVSIAGDGYLAVGQMGLVIRGNGNDWQEVDSGSDERLFGVARDSQGLAFAVGAFGTVLRSSDGGTSWESLEIDWMALAEDLGFDPHIYDVHIDEAQRITLVGEFGMIIRSTDLGESWETLNTGDASLFSLLVNGAVTYAVGQDGVVLRSDDDGGSWERLDTPVTANLMGIAVSADGRRLVAPGMRSVLYSADSGRTWQEIVTREFGRGWYVDAVWSERSGGFLVVGHGGRMQRISDRH